MCHGTPHGARGVCVTVVAVDMLKQIAQALKSNTHVKHFDAGGAMLALLLQSAACAMRRTLSMYSLLTCTARNEAVRFARRGAAPRRTAEAGRRGDDGTGERALAPGAGRPYLLWCAKSPCLI